MINRTELEIETIKNFLVRESIEIINEEVEYFCLTREKSVDSVLAGIPPDNLEFKAVRGRLNNVLYTKDDVKFLVQKIEKRIIKEIRMAQWNCDFRFNLQQISWVEPGNVVVLLQEEIKTLFYSAAMGKAIDTAWAKIKKQFIPAGFNRLSSKIKVGELVLSSVQLNSQKVMDDLKSKIARLLRGSLKQYRTQLCKDLSKQVYQQIFLHELCCPDNVQLAEVQTA